MSLPIVYVRGYAGSTGGINAAVDDSFYGFNIGATHVRVGVTGSRTSTSSKAPSCGC